MFMCQLGSFPASLASVIGLALASIKINVNSHLTIYFTLVEQVFKVKTFLIYK
jgi:hypothetical protein